MIISRKTPDGLRPMTSEEIEAAAFSDLDAQPLTSDDLRRMRQTPQSKIIRRALGLTPEQFCTRFNIPLSKVLDWEQGRSEPNPSERAQLKEIAHELCRERRQLQTEHDPASAVGVEQGLNERGVTILRQAEPILQASAQASSWLASLFTPDLLQPVPATRSISPTRGAGAVPRETDLDKDQVAAALLQSGIFVIPVRMSPVSETSSILSLYFLDHWPEASLSLEVTFDDQTITPELIRENRRDRLLEIQLPIPAAELHSCAIQQSGAALALTLKSVRVA